MSGPSGHRPFRYFFRQVLAWGAGSAVGAIFPAVAQGIIVKYYPTINPLSQAAIIGIIALGSAFIGGGLGYAFSVWFDEPPMSSREIKHAILFGLVFTMLFYCLFSFAALGFMTQHPESQWALTAVLGFISGFLSAGLKGVLNNFREESKYYRDRPHYYEGPGADV